MPTLRGDVREAAEAAADGQWQDPIGGLLAEGWYVVSLMEVKDIGGENDRWDWVFYNFRSYDMATGEIGGVRAGRTWWTTTNTPDSIAKLKATFHAFDAELDTNTNELLEEDVLIYLDQHVARQGKMKDQTVNGATAIRALPDKETEAAGRKL